MVSDDGNRDSRRFPPSLQALAVIAIVLLEAVLLYVGYGTVEDAVGAIVLDRLAET
ncbi:hypothetical protein BN903_37 [Halorubrum sp. AJ67]|nr:hypothetical protein BN903_37 [Halorubrum sp. AJ67]